MLDNKKIEELQKRVKNHIQNRVIQTKGNKEFVEFFLTNAHNSLNAAKLLFDVSTKDKLQEDIGYLNFDGFLWVINASYYSMFYMARALLESEGIKIKTELSIHSLTFDILVYYFYLTGKLQKKLIDFFVESQEEAAEILSQEIAHELIEDYFMVIN